MLWGFPPPLSPCRRRGRWRAEKIFNFSQTCSLTYLDQRRDFISLSYLINKSVKKTRVRVLIRLLFYRSSLRGNENYAQNWRPTLSANFVRSFRCHAVPTDKIIIRSKRALSFFNWFIDQVTETDEVSLLIEVCQRACLTNIKYFFCPSPSSSSAWWERGWKYPQHL